jgi:hypothetical protein
MPIRDKKSDVFRDQRVGGAVLDASRTNGRPRHVYGTVANLADDDSGSLFHLCDLPSACILHEETFFDVTNDGYATIRIGTRTDSQALVNVLKSAGNEVLPVVRGGANHGLPLWQRLGLPRNPGGVIGIYKHAIANAVAAGSTRFRISYVE